MSEMREVVHAEWIFELHEYHSGDIFGDDLNMYFTARCSNCEHSFHDDQWVESTSLEDTRRFTDGTIETFRDQFKRTITKTKMPPYCEHCGAIMDQGKVKKHIQNIRPFTSLSLSPELEEIWN